MQDWLRSLTVLGMAFMTVVAVTIALATVIVPNRTAPSMGRDGSSLEAAAAPAGELHEPPRSVIAELRVTGDLDGAFRLTHAATDAYHQRHRRHSLVGDDGRIAFEGPPAEVAQMSYEGWEFFPDPDECTVTPDELDRNAGTGSAELRCEEVADVRGNGVITVAGMVTLPLDLLMERELPESGGTVAVGDETWEFEEAHLSTWETPAIGGRPHYDMTLLDITSAMDVTPPHTSFLNFTYDRSTHRVTLTNIARDGESVDVDEAACEVRREELGALNPRTTVVELAVRCAEVDVPGLGPVPISGTVVVDELSSPE